MGWALSCIATVSLCVWPALGIAASTGAGTSPTTASQTWLIASDIHLNPYDHAKAPTSYLHDTNLALFDTALSHMKGAVPDPAVVVLPGDFLEHHFHGDAIATMQYIATRFGRAFPRARFLIALGNNDDQCGDYAMTYDSPYLRRLAAVWAPLVMRDGASPNFVASFAHNGSYVAALPHSSVRVVAVNDVYFAAHYRNWCGPHPRGSQHPRSGELAWLQHVLAQTPAGERNLVLMHIPLGPDAFSTALYQGTKAVPFLAPIWEARLRAVLANPRNRVAAILAGHTHRSEDRHVGEIPLTVVASISPIFGGNPSFFVAKAGADGLPRIVESHVFDEHRKVWQTLPGFDAYTGDVYARCAQPTPTHAEYAACIDERGRRERIVAIAAVLLAVAIAVLVLWLRRSMRRG